MKKVKKITTKAVRLKPAEKKSPGKGIQTETEKPSVKKAAKKTTKRAAQKKSPKASGRAASEKLSNSKSTKRKTHKRRKTTLSKAELAYFRNLLIEKLKEIQGDVDHIESEALKKSRMDASGDLSSMPIHMADIGSDNYEQEFSLGLMDSERKIVHEIHEAIKRIENNTYGICEGTGDPIPKVRLEGIPWTRYCVQYAERIEKGLANDDDHWYDTGEDAEQDDDMLDEEDFLDDEEHVDGEDEDEKESLFYGYDDDEDDKDLV